MKIVTKLHNNFPKIAKITLISVYLIFLAGAIVRMTGSGMGCPDWPKCFGYYIPPTSEAEITWAPDTDYEKGMIIVKDKELFVAEKKLTTNTVFEINNWTKYTKHNYAVFNKYHTWTEYINRLASVIAGFVFIFLIIGSFGYWKKDKTITLLSFFALFLMGVEALLGKIVVDTNLKPAIITVHMLVGLVILAVLLFIIYRLDENKKQIKFNYIFNRLLIISAVFSLIQIGMGTQVRQFIDGQVKLLGFANKEYVLMSPNFNFYFHRSFTIAIVLVNFALFYINQQKNYGLKLLNWVLVLIGLETITGILMYYVSFPIGTQAIHLLAGSLLFGIQFYLWLQTRKSIAKD